MSEPEKKMRCPSCGFEMIGGKYCPQCRAELVDVNTVRPAPEWEDQMVERISSRVAEKLQPKSPATPPEVPPQTGEPINAPKKTIFSR